MLCVRHFIADRYESDGAVVDVGVDVQVDVIMEEPRGAGPKAQNTG